MSLSDKLLKIQTELKAPKNQYNSFGNYSYRSSEDILEGLKPLLAEHKATLYISDEVSQIGDRYYIRATVTLVDLEDNSELSVSAYAREEENKKGMDASQITGSTSSYARKYALNGLFAIDDTKDSDATNTHNKGQEKTDKSKKQETKGGEVKFYCSDCGVEVNQAVHSFSINKFSRCLCRTCQNKAK